MPEWNPTELEQIAVAPEIEISSLREDGAWLRKSADGNSATSGLSEK